MTACLHCGGTGIEPDRVAALAAECRRLGMVVTFDGYVSEADAARLLGRSVFTLRNRRLECAPIPFRRLGRRPQYALAVLANLRLSRAS